MSPILCGPAVDEIVVVDRIVEDVAVLEWSPECLTDVPVAWLPVGVHEGDTLRVQVRRTPPPFFSVGGGRPSPRRRAAKRAAPVTPRPSVNEEQADG